VYLALKSFIAKSAANVNDYVILRFNGIKPLQSGPKTPYKAPSMGLFPWKFTGFVPYPVPKP
jgi:hypothetical protein